MDADDFRNDDEVIQGATWNGTAWVANKVMHVRHQAWHRH
jgi:hypothetical protein